VTAEPLRLHRIDLRVVGGVAALALLGYVLQCSVREAAPPGSVEKTLDFARAQLTWYAAGTLVAFLVLMVPYRLLLDHAFALYGAGLLLLAAVFVVGTSVNGAKRWIDLGPAMLQPSELMKLGVILVLARWIRFRDDRKTFLGLAVPFLLTAVPIALILRQPDLGTALLFVPVLMVVLFASGARPRHLGLVVAMAILCTPLLYAFALKDYQRERVKTFLTFSAADSDPEARRMQRQEGWQTHQARLAVAAGGLGGAGWAEGLQNRAGAVPEHQTDFILTVLAEEGGFAGVCLMSVLYGVLFVSLAGIARRSRDPAGKLLVTGVIALLASQAYVNAAMVVGLGPVTGVPLPFLTYGGTTTLTSFTAVALALNVGARPGFDFGRSDFD
jgi:rod shape determining protein RodA